MVASDEGAPRSDAWLHAGGTLALTPPVVMAVLNVTPDSFHDGGALYRAGSIDVPAVREAAARAVDAGAGLLDVGGESTRPGADPVDPGAEQARVVAAIEAIRDLGVPVSCDTRRASVARAALEAGAVIINDVSGLADPQMASVAAAHGAGIAIGHLRGVPKTMQSGIAFSDLLAEIGRELRAGVDAALAAGVRLEQVVVDPGIGFGKSAQQSAALVGASSRMRAATGCPVMIGASRKSFIGALSEGGPQTRLPGSLAAAVVAVQRGASIVRVHDVAETVQALAVAAAVDAAVTEEGAAS
ncbi:MAG: dihydropteroate synthase [Myxococcota bacterium]